MGLRYTYNQAKLLATEEVEVNDVDIDKSTEGIPNSSVFAALCANLGCMFKDLCEEV